MTSFRAENRALPRRAFVAAVALTALLASATQAQQASGPPRGLGTRPPETPTNEDEKSDASRVKTLEGRPGLNESSVEVDVLSDVDDSGAGLLGAASGGFGPDVWTRSERLAIELLLPSMPVATPSPAMNALGRRLLLSSAPVPPGVTGGMAILPLRLERLFEAGELDAVREIVDKNGRLAEDSDAALYAAWADLLQRRTNEACAIAAGLKQDRDRVDWARLRTLCFALSGESAAADLTADLLREQGGADDLFLALVSRLTAKSKGELPRATTIDPVHVALFAETGTAPGDAEIADASPVILAAIAADERFPLDMRLDAGERAARVGAFPADALASLFDGVSFDEAQVASPLSQADALPPARGTALLYRAVKTLSVPAAAAEALRAALERARAQGLYTVAARLYWPILRGVEPSDSYAAVAADLGRFALIHGDVAAARDWYDMARQSPLTDADATRELGILLTAADAGENRWRSNDAATWLAEAADEDLFARRVDEILALEIVGYPVPQAVRTRTLAASSGRTGYLPPPAVMARLENAAQVRSRGETVLLSLVALGPSGPGQASPDALRTVYNALASAGLESEARSLVLDALLARQAMPATAKSDSGEADG